jgi:hypothetical protein
MAMSEPDADALIRVAAFEHVRRLAEIHGVDDDEF